MKIEFDRGDKREKYGLTVSRKYKHYKIVRVLYYKKFNISVLILEKLISWRRRQKLRFAIVFMLILFAKNGMAESKYSKEYIEKTLNALKAYSFLIKFDQPQFNFNLQDYVVSNKIIEKCINLYFENNVMFEEFVKSITSMFPNLYTSKKIAVWLYNVDDTTPPEQIEYDECITTEEGYIFYKNKKKVYEKNENYIKAIKFYFYYDVILCLESYTPEIQPLEKKEKNEENFY